jgi:uncharacterized protein YggU (UPF0235/DUF167 family)
VALIFTHMLIKVKVFPGCKKYEILKKKDDEFEVRVKEKAEREEQIGLDYFT